MSKDNSQGPLSVHVSELPVEGLDLSGEIPFAELGIEEDAVTELPWPVIYRLHLVQLGEDLLVTGTVTAAVRLLCDRCAEFSRSQLPDGDVCHRYENVAGQVVDLTEDIREDILIVFPQSHLCSEDCRGLCPRCGHNLNEGDCGCAPLELDWEDDDADDESADHSQDGEEGLDSGEEQNKAAKAAETKRGGKQSGSARKPAGWKNGGGNPGNPWAALDGLKF